MIALALTMSLVAAPDDVARLPVTTESDAEAVRTVALEEALHDGWTRVGLTRELAPPEPCPAAACWKAASDADIRYLLRATVRARGRDYEIVIEILDVRTREVVARTSEPCEVCGLEEARDMIERQVAVVSEKLDRLRVRRTQLTVTSEPPGARVFVDRRIVGKTPLQSDVVGGSHLIDVEHPGYVRATHRIDAVGGVAETLDVRLIEARSGGARVGRIVGATLLGAGPGLIIPGAVLWGLDGHEYTKRCSRTDVDLDGDCRFLYNTRTEGIALAVVGGVMLVAGVAVLLAARRTKGRRHARKRPAIAWGWGR